MFSSVKVVGQSVGGVAKISWEGLNAVEAIQAKGNAENTRTARAQMMTACPGTLRKRNAWFKALLLAATAENK